ncbi:UNVERIFIED_CONTAM: hypothetical protein Sangu_1569200 [Sesamum angustifolium]|uniref:MULE transposase domain-containing protein n=1 Tax=Sesamum angustifolium TaxID=2727405 RepID=A0AAW2MSH1_9LAMI
MARRRYDIVLHMFDEQDVLPRVDPRYYTFQKLLDDIGRCRLIPEGVVDTIFFDIYVDCEDKNERIHVVCDEDVIEMFHRNVVTAEVHVWIHAELITPLGTELHVIDLDAEEDVQTDGVEAEGVDQEAESDECDSARGAGQTNEDEDDGLMSGYSSDDALLDAVSENEGDKEDEGEDEDEDEPEDPMKNYYIEISIQSKKKALEQIDGNYGDSYSKLPHYAEMGPYGGVLLAAIGLDGNNGLFPLAFAVVESECKDSWCFFFQALDEMLGGFAVDRPWTFMSDRQKGLLECINDMVPHAINRRCARHLFANFKQHFSGMPLKKYFWQACRSYNEEGFNSAMKKIQEFKPGAAEWLMKIDVSMWAK